MPIKSIAISKLSKRIWMAGKIENVKQKKYMGDEIHHYNIRTRQACNVVFNDEENFRMIKNILKTIKTSRH